jgi:hypothetical protein
MMVEEHRRTEKHSGKQIQNLKRGDHFTDPGTRGKIILRITLETGCEY